MEENSNDAPRDVHLAVEPGDPFVYMGYRDRRREYPLRPHNCSFLTLGEGCVLYYWHHESCTCGVNSLHFT